jgi:7,8-dihydro-6-hydroxymethylpterin-pyrophosphokinase
LSEGYYLNPENTVPNTGLASIGISVPLGSRINQRMADLRKAKMQLGQAERKLLAIAVLYDASVAYFNWKKTLKNFKCIHSTTPMPKRASKPFSL